MAVDPTLTATIVCSWGGKYDTTYATVEEADAVIAGRLNSATWKALTAIQKISSLISASRDVDISFNWVGSKYFYNQVLEFPRKTTEEIYAAEPDSTFYESLNSSQYQVNMKRNVKLACIEQALWLARMGGIDTHLENQARGVGSYSESYGSVSESYSYKGATPSKLCPDSRKLLREYRGYPRLVRG
jgi:hypothetical protein